MRAQKRESEAGAAYENALAIQPNDYEAWVGLAAVRGALEEAGAEAEAYEQALKLRPAEVVAWLNLGISYTMGERMEDAEGAFRQAR